MVFIKNMDKNKMLPLNYFHQQEAFFIFLNIDTLIVQPVYNSKDTYSGIAIIGTVL